MIAKLLCLLFLCLVAVQANDQWWWGARPLGLQYSANSSYGYYLPPSYYALVSPYQNNGGYYTDYRGYYQPQSYFAGTPYPNNGGYSNGYNGYYWPQSYLSGWSYPYNSGYNNEYNYNYQPQSPPTTSAPDYNSYSKTVSTGSKSNFGLGFSLGDGLKPYSSGKTYKRAKTIENGVVTQDVNEVHDLR